jgi:hypothetical protein
VGAEQQSFGQFWVDTDVATGVKDRSGWARMSEDGKYRYSLGRHWGDEVRLGIPSSPAVTFIMLNPSTADATVDDPTIRRCMGFAKRLGQSSLLVVNLFAFRATDPAELSAADDPVGKENDKVIRRACLPSVSVCLIAAWGALGTRYHTRVNEVLHIVTTEAHRHLAYFGNTKSGQPKHPLYLASNAELLKPWG